MNFFPIFQIHEGIFFLNLTNRLILFKLKQMSCQKLPLIFRRTSGNRFSIPVLLNALEKRDLQNKYEIGLADSLNSLFLQSGTGTPIIAYSFMTAHVPEVWKEVRTIRRKSKAILIAGGPHPTGDPECALRMGFDFVFSGEAENVFPEFCLQFAETGRLPEKRVWTDPFPVCLDESFSFSKTDAFIPPLELTRGCFHGCRFCQTCGRRPVHRSIQSVERYLDEIHRRNLLSRLGFICPSGFEYGAPRAGKTSTDAIERLLSAAGSRHIRYLEYAIFPSEVRPETVNPDLLGLVKSVCSNKKITVGAQTGSERLLKTIRRGHTVEDIERAAELIRRKGFRPQMDFILGFPGETSEDRTSTSNLMKRLGRKYGAWNQAHYFLPLSGTPLYRSKPSPLDAVCVKTLEQFAADGICSDWWKKDVELSAKIVETLEELSIENANSNPT
jgi:B12-binding domain/radical SAM domain protein